MSILKSKSLISIDKCYHISSFNILYGKTGSQKIDKIINIRLIVVKFKVVVIKITCFLSNSFISKGL